MVKAGGLRNTLEAMLSNKAIYRLRMPWGRPTNILKTSRMKPSKHSSALSLQRSAHSRPGSFVNAFDNKHTVAIEPKLKTFEAPTLIVWGTDDIYFDVKWSRWLADEIPGTQRRVEFKSARIFFAEERPEEFNRELRGFWKQTE